MLADLLLPIEALLFDLDGTLAHTESVNAEAYAKALAELGVVVDFEVVRQATRGRHWRQFLPELLSTANSPASAAEVAARKAELYRDAAARIQFNEGLLRLLSSSRQHYKTALVTTASRATVNAIFADTLRSRLFDAVITGDDVLAYKPDPEPYLTAADLLQVQPSRCLVFEDSQSGIASAQAAGMQVVVTSIP